MSFLDDVDVLILTYNEAPNIARTLACLAAFPSVVVLDSNSTDDTVAIARGFANVHVAARAFDAHATQWQHGLDALGLTREWVLALDADYAVPADLIEEIRRLRPEASIAGYRVGFRYSVLGRTLRANLYPPVVALYRRRAAHYLQDGHTQRVVVDGAVAELAGRINHDDRKPLARWLASQQRYAMLEAEHLLAQDPGQLRRTDRLRLMAWPAPFLMFAYALFAKRCILDGWPGWFYVLQRTLAEIMIALAIIERRRQGR